MGVAVEFTVSGVEHDSDQLAYTVEVLSSQGAVVHSDRGFVCDRREF
jgi:hypothetical protein